MILVSTIRDIDDTTKEGMMLIGALAILTSIDKKDISDKKWGGMIHPDDALKKVSDLSNQIYFEKEWEAEKVIRIRDEKISKLIRE
jgi:hypothetical protein